VSNPIEALLGPDFLARTDFPTNSRYHGIPTRAKTQPDGTLVTYLAVRICPAAERFATLSQQTIGQSRRLDQTAATLIGDPEQFWLLCDANGAIWPEELEQEGTIIRVTLPLDMVAPEDPQ